MSKKSKWNLTSSNDSFSFKMLSAEEKVKYWKDRKARERKMFKDTLKLQRMEDNKVKFNKKKEEEEEDNE